MVKKNFLKSSLIVLVALAMVLPVIPTISFAASKPIITYSAHMQTYGWDSTNKAPNSELTAKEAAKDYAGKIGESKRMEALEVNLSTLPGVTLKYRAHVQTFGWQDWVTADTKADHAVIAGTTGLSKRVEALQLSVEGLEGYKILYRAHVQTYGWLDWVDADDPNAFAGTSGESKRMEAFEIVVVPKDEYAYSDKGNGTHSVSYKGMFLKEEPCSYGEWTPSINGSTEYKQFCALCGHESGKTTTLQDALTKAYTDGVGEVKAENVTLPANQTLTVPAGVTLSVSGTLNVPSEANLVIDGNVVAKYLAGGMDANGTRKNVKVSNTGSFTLAGKYDEDTDLDKTILGNALQTDYLTHIVLEEGSQKQNITGQVPVNSEKLTVDLNGTEVNGTVATSSMIKVNGDLTVNNGVFVNTTGNGFLLDGKGSLTINGGSITVGGTAVGANGKLPTNKANSKDPKDYDLTGMNVNLTNVEIKSTDAGAYAINLYGNNGLATLNNVNITAKSLCLGTNGATENTAYKVTGGKLVSETSMVAYLPAVGDNVFTNVTLKGLDGIEVAGGSLTVSGSTITATRPTTTEAVYTSEDGMVLNGNGTDSYGAAILLKIAHAYGKDKEKFDLTVTNSTVTSEYNSAVMVIEHHETNQANHSALRTVNTSFTGSTIQGFSKVTNTNAVTSAEKAIIYVLRQDTLVNK